MKAKILLFVDRMRHRGRHLEATLYSRATRPAGVIPVPAGVAPRRSLRATWRRSPVTGRLEISWQAVEAEALEAGWASTGHPEAA